MKPQILYFYGGVWQPLAANTALYKSFSTLEQIQELYRQVVALAPDTEIVDVTDQQAVLFQAPDNIRMYQFNGHVKDGSIVMESAGLLLARKTDRKLFSGGNIDHPTGDDLVVRSDTFGYATLGWGA